MHYQDEGCGIMKKSFWGYNVKEVDENIQYLESVNETLSKKVARLTQELEEAGYRAEESAPAEEGFPAKSEPSEAAAAVPSFEEQKLRDTISQLTDENDDLMQKNLSLSTQLEEMRRENQVGKNGLADINGARQSVNEKLHDYVQTVMPELHDKLSVMDIAQKQILEFCANSRESFLDAADAILAQYDSFLSAAQEDENVNNEYMETTEALRIELNQIIDTFLPPEPVIEYKEKAEPKTEKTIDTHRVLQDIINRSANRDREAVPAKEEDKQEPSIVRVPDKVKAFTAVEPKQEAPKIVTAARKDMTASDSKNHYSGALFETTDINDMMRG